ncbi:hypothetical protein QE152_g29249 [Popillia japonica]|uniref:Uncharacterized protein n=1 Tax=Popillia japonica TaxID=7064 RepID=A0AAW1JJN6_POPJA
MPSNLPADKTLKKGDYDFRQSNMVISFYKWRDNRIVYVASNYHGNERSSVSRKQNDGTSISVVYPLSIKDYNNSAHAGLWNCINCNLASITTISDTQVLIRKEDCELEIVFHNGLERKLEKMEEKWEVKTEEIEQATVNLEIETKYLGDRMVKGEEKVRKIEEKVERSMSELGMQEMVIMKM